ncbi:MAG: GxxExxY protein [bacterium]|nr:GxxExxY protein [bacterium]
MTFQERLTKHKSCPFYEEGACCRACYMGPCRITDKAKEGVCGATDSTISARNLGRMAAAGASSLSTAVSMLGVQQKDWFSSQKEKGLDISKILPPERVALLNRLHLTPRNIHREIVELLHRVSIGVDQEAEHILLQTIRCSLGGLLAGALLPKDEKAESMEIDTSLLSEERPNIILFGNVQLSSDKVQVIKVDSILALEVLIASGLVDVILSDQLAPHLAKYTAACFHTLCIHSEEKDVIEKAIKAQEKRAQTLNFKGRVSRPKLSGQILKNSLLDSNIRGIVWVSGCPNPTLEDKRKEIIEELVANDVLVLLTGCSVRSILETGLLDSPSAQTGEFLKGFSEKTSLPPVVYLGGCLKEGEVIRLFNEIGGGKDLADLPIALMLPSWRSERNISLILGTIACGISVQVGSHLPIVPEIRGFLDSGCNEMLLSHLLSGDASILEYINRKRERLGLAPELSLYEPKKVAEDYHDKVAVAGFSVYRELGGGLSTEVYKKALDIELKSRGINTTITKATISYLNEVVFETEELLVEDELIVCAGIDNSIQKLAKTALLGAKREKALWLVFGKEMLKIGCINLTKKSSGGV